MGRLQQCSLGDHIVLWVTDGVRSRSERPAQQRSKHTLPSTAKLLPLRAKSLLPLAHAPAPLPSMILARTTRVARFSFALTSSMAPLKQWSAASMSFPSRAFVTSRGLKMSREIGSNHNA